MKPVERQELPVVNGSDVKQVVEILHVVCALENMVLNLRLGLLALSHL